MSSPSFQEEPALFQLIRNGGSAEAVRLYLQHFPASLALPVYQGETALMVAVQACFAAAAVSEMPGGYDALDLRFRILHVLAKHVGLHGFCCAGDTGRTIFHVAVNPPAAEEGTAAAPAGTQAIVSCAVLEVLLEKLKPCEDCILFRRDTSEPHQQQHLALHTAITHGNYKAAEMLLNRMAVSNRNYRDYDFCCVDQKDNTTIAAAAKPTPVLHALLRQLSVGRKFLKQLLVQFPEAASVPDCGDNDKLPIIVALEHTLSARKLELIVTVYPEALSIPTGDGDLPLHLAALYYNHENNNGDERCYAVLRLLIQHYPSALTTNNCYGQWPLHCTMEWNEDNNNSPELMQHHHPLDLAVLQLLSNHGLVDSDDYHENNSEATPVEHALSTVVENDVVGGVSWEEFTSSLGASSQTASSFESLGNQTRDDDVAHVRKQQPDASYTSSALYHTDCYGDLPLHVACRRLSTVTVETFAWLLECHPEAARQRNEYEHLPLHLVAANNNDDDASSSSDSESPSIVECVKLLIDAYPEAVYEPDDEGDVPLQCAVIHPSVSPSLLQCLLEATHSQGVDGNRADFATRQHATENLLTGQLPLHTACANRVFSEEILDALLAYHPAALFHYDKDGYLPFHVALLQSSCPLPVIHKLLYGWSDSGTRDSLLAGHRHGQLVLSRSTLPCTATGVAAIFVACESASENDSDEDQASSLDIIRFLVKCSPEIFVRSSISS